MRRANPKALLISLVVMLILDTVGSVLLALLFTSHGSQRELTPQQTPAAFEAVVQSNGFLLSALVYGTITTIVGGYLAARLARNFPYFNAGLLGLVGIALGVLLASDSPFWFDAIAFIVTLPAALYGGHLAKRRANGVAP